MIHFLILLVVFLAITSLFVYKAFLKDCKERLAQTKEPIEQTIMCADPEPAITETKVELPKKRKYTKKKNVKKMIANKKTSPQ